MLEIYTLGKTAVTHCTAFMAVTGFTVRQPRHRCIVYAGGSESLKLSCRPWTQTRHRLGVLHVDSGPQNGARPWPGSTCFCKSVCRWSPSEARAPAWLAVFR